jgi:sulfur relay (sulfurtransferase) DsrF/TusC family protein
MADEAPVLVIVSVDPETSHRANEAVRIALGILAGENPVTIALVGPGVKVLSADAEDHVDGEDLLRHLGTFKKLGQVFHVERSGIPEGASWNPAGVTVVPLDLDGLARLVTASRRVLTF